MTYRAVTASTTLTNNDYILSVSPAANVTVTLPAVASVQPGRPYFILRDDTATNTVTLDGSGSETIDGATTLAVGAAGQYGALRIVSTGSAWRVISAYDSVDAT
jgi:hypothetical protein